MAAEERRWHYGWTVLIVGTLVVAGSIGLARFGYTIVLPPMQKGLGLTTTEAGMLATFNLIGYLALALLGGALASHWGPRAVITAGLVVVGLGLLLTGYTHSFAGAAFWRLVTGVGTGASNVPVMGLLSAWFAVRRRGLAAGVAVSGSSLVLIALGPTVPRVLAAHPDSGWRLCWYGFGMICLVLAALGAIFLRNRPGELGLGKLGDDGPAPAAADAPQPLRWKDVYHNPRVWHLGLVYSLSGFSYIIYMTFFVKCLVAEGGYTQPEAGQLFMVMGWCSLACGLLWGHVSDVIGRKGAMCLVFAVHTVSFGLYGLYPQPLGFVVSAALFGLTAWSIPAIVAAACGDMLGSRLAPAALGLVTLCFGIGQALGPLAAGMLADARGSLFPAMTMAALVALAGALLSLTLPGMHRHGTVPAATAPPGTPPPPG